MAMLIPRDCWNYQLGDLWVGLAAGMRSEVADDDLALPGIGSCVPAQSGRSALVAALEVLSLPAGARIGVPLFCCPVVFQAIRAAACIPVFLDVEPDTFCLCPRDLSAKASQLDAVLAVHMFGNVCDVPAIQQSIGDKPVIEDCAQALGSRLAGRAAGTLGRVAFFSFRLGKYISAGWGGALFSPDSTIQTRMRKLVASRPSPRRAAEGKHVLAQYLKTLLRTRPGYGWLGYRLWSANSRHGTASHHTAVEPDPIYRADLAVARRRLKELEQAIQIQRDNAEYLGRQLVLERDMLCLEKPGTFSNRYLYPITFGSAEERDAMAVALFERGIDSMKYLNDVVSIAREFHGYAGGCCESESLSRRVLVVPAYHTLRPKDLRHIVTALNEEWKRIQPRKFIAAPNRALRVLAAKTP